MADAAVKFKNVTRIVPLLAQLATLLLATWPGCAPPNSLWSNLRRLELGDQWGNPYSESGSNCL